MVCSMMIQCENQHSIYIHCKFQETKRPGDKVLCFFSASKGLSMAAGCELFNWTFQESDCSQSANSGWKVFEVYGLLLVVLV